MGRPRNSEREESGDPRELILRSARAEVEKNGILGLRVAEVAANAHYSVSIIYRYFGDRDGLLAQVLGDLYEEILDRAAHRLATGLPASGPLTIDQIVSLAPMPSEADMNPDLKLRLQILAVAATNPELEARLKSIAQTRLQQMKAWSQAVKSRLPEGQIFDDRILFILIVNQLLYYNTLLGDDAVTDEEYFRFLKDKITKI
jgi:AcrR family transcriptional regulator